MFARVATEEVCTYHGLVEEYGREFIVTFSNRRGAPSFRSFGVVGVGIQE